MVIERKVQDVTILVVPTHLTIGAGDSDIRSAVNDVLAAGSKKIVLDCSKVSRMDSSGVGELVAAYTSTTNKGGELRLLDLSPKVAQVLQVTRLAGILESYETEEAVVASFAD